MKICLCIFSFVVGLALVPARAADATPATPPADKPAINVTSDLPKSTDPLIDPLTGTPYIAVHNGDIVESVIFITEFQRAHPEEHAVLLIGGIEDDLSSRTLDPAAAFSWKGKTYIHSYAIGDVLVPEVPPESIEGYESRIYKVYRHLIHYYYQQSFEKKHIPFPSQDEELRMGYADTMPHVLLSELTGDTDVIQALRVKQRLIKLGLANVKAFQNLPRKNKHGMFICDQVNFDFGGLAFTWSTRGCKYTGLASKIYLPSMIDSVIFSIDYQKAHPSERVFCFLHAASGTRHMPGLTVSTTVFTKNGELWFHHLAPGDLPSALSLDDLKDSDRVIAADLAAYAPAMQKFDEQEARLRHQPPSGLNKYLHGYKAPDLSANRVLVELKQRGVEAKIAGDPESPELLFIWGGQPYTYKPGLGCFAGKSDQSTASN